MDTDFGTKGQSLAEAEQNAIRILDPELRRHLDLTEFAFNLISQAQVKVPDTLLREVPQARKVCRTLLVRLSNDLRCAALTAVRGYAVQTLSLVASMYEVAFTIAAIGNDETVAQRWIAHDDPTQFFMKIKELTQCGLAAVGVTNPAQDAAQHYLIYRQLCMAKHANPLFQMQHGYQLRDNAVVAENGPDVSESAVRALWFALEHAANLAFLALCSFVRHYVPGSDALPMLPEIKTLGARRTDLHDLAVDRWGTEDPFPGKWRL